MRHNDASVTLIDGGVRAAGSAFRKILIIMAAVSFAFLARPAYSAVMECAGDDAEWGTLWNFRFGDYGFAPGEMQTELMVAPGGTIWTKGITRFSLDQWYASGADSSQVISATFYFDGCFMAYTQNAQYEQCPGYDVSVGNIIAPAHGDIAGFPKDYFYADTLPAGTAIHSGTEMHACVDVLSAFMRNTQLQDNYLSFSLEAPMVAMLPRGYFNSPRLEIVYNDSAAPSPVPEPGAFFLMSTGLAAAFLAGKRKHLKH